jgi:ATP-dependent Clp protease ATP-binding subunit ClpC
MNGYNFTERVRKVLQMAREEAARLHHEYVGTEHILLGLIREGEGVAAAVLELVGLELGQQVENLRLDRHVQRGDRLVGHDEVGVDHRRRRSYVA